MSYILLLIPFTNLVPAYLVAFNLCARSTHTSAVLVISVPIPSLVSWILYRRLDHSFLFRFI